jgi:hypothetical protein
MANRHLDKEWVKAREKSIKKQIDENKATKKSKGSSKKKD